MWRTQTIEILPNLLWLHAAVRAVDAYVRTTAHWGDNCMSQREIQGWGPSLLPDVKHKTATAHISFQVSMAVTVQNERNIKMGLKLRGWKGVEWIYLVRNRDQ